ncbi:MAG: cysteine desulfurase, SufS subfamily [Labilithrix sp.]|nr:cysteine desulfurase, SufS subfamily [Labilithrix sp.]
MLGRAVPAPPSRDLSDVRDASPLSAAEVASIRAQFPAFQRLVNGRPLVYLDSASTAQKPQAVIDAVTRAMSATANIHRGVHQLSVETTEAYEAVRGKAARLLGAKDPREIVFTRGTTEALNLVARSWGRANVGPGDEILVTELEHHSNLVPWQMLAAEAGATLRVLPIDARGDVVLDALDDLLGPRTRVVALAHVSNSLGTVLPVAAIAERARAAGAITVVDGAQAAPHLLVDVAALGCDFYAFSGHKLYGPTGAGVLWGRRALLEAMPPWQGGGDMVLSVTFAETTYNDVPYRFEAGTPDILSVIGMGAAIDWVTAIGLPRIAAREAELLARATRILEGVAGLRLVGTAPSKAAVISFVLGALHPHDVGTALDLEGVAVRTGHHCTQPVMEHFGIDGTVRASLGIYSNEEDLDHLAAALARAGTLLGA